VLRTLVTRPEAEAEITEAAEWYDDQRPGLGDEFLAAVRDAAVRAVEAPARYRRVERDLRWVLLHRFPYALIFRESATELVVFGCVHLRRDPATWRSRG
jgi:toxin ParE1/3/4